MQPGSRVLSRRVSDENLPENISKESFWPDGRTPSDVETVKGQIQQLIKELKSEEADIESQNISYLKKLEKLTGPLKR